MNMSKKYTLELTLKEIKLIQQALLFSTCADLCGDWKDEDEILFYKLAKKILKNTSVTPKLDLYTYECGPYEDEKLTLAIIDEFKIETREL